MQRLECFALRFTPTGVGTIVSELYADIEHTVHPHGRGDNAHTASAKR